MSAHPHSPLPETAPVSVITGAASGIGEARPVGTDSCWAMSISRGYTGCPKNFGPGARR